jgi:hypothetical protein
MQAAQLYNDEKQEKHTGQAGVQKVLPLLPGTYCTQGNQVVRLVD